MTIEVMMWKANNGTLHDTKDKAEYCDERTELRDYIDNHPLYGNSDGCTIRGDDLLEWLKDNPRIYLMLTEEKDGD